MKGEIEIYINDLKEEKKQEVLSLYGVNTPEEANLDIMPLYILEVN